jgi:signal transduction histidine kinase
MSPEILERVFEPFFTQKRGVAGAGSGGTGEGTGLGLSISHAIIERHGGRLTAESAGPGRGSRFVVELPLWSQAPAAKGAAAVPIKA